MAIAYWFDHNNEVILSGIMGEGIQDIPSRDTAIGYISWIL